MTRTEELLALAEAVNVPKYLPERTTEDINKLRSNWDEYRDVCNPKTIKQLVALVRLQNEALKWHTGMTRPIARTDEAIAAFEKFERGE